MRLANYWWCAYCWAWIPATQHAFDHGCKDMSYMDPQRPTQKAMRGAKQVELAWAQDLWDETHPNEPRSTL